MERRPRIGGVARFGKPHALTTDEILAALQFSPTRSILKDIEMLDL